MRYNPEDANANLIPSETWLQATIETAVEKVSKSGNEMIEAGFKVYDQAGKQPIIKHYFVSTAPGMFKKLCKVLSLDFESGCVSAESLVGKNLFVKIKIQKDETGRYDDKNVIAAFADKLPDGQVNDIVPQKQDLQNDDGIPF